MPTDHEPDPAQTDETDATRSLRERITEAVVTARERQAGPPPRPLVVEVPADATAEADRSHVPPLVRAASEWTWRLLLIAAGIAALIYLVGFLSEVTYPIIVAILLAALLEPLFRRLASFMPRGLAAIITVLGTLAVIVGLFSFVVNQFAAQLPDLVGQVGQGVDQIRTWVLTTFNLSNNELTGYLDRARESLGQSEIGTRAAQAGLTVGHLLAGAAITMFALFFFLYDGPQIWGWVVRLFPRAVRAKAISGGRIAWGQLQAFTRATILVAAVDALGIGLGALALGVPFASGIGLLVFLGAFIPVIGALLSGFIAVVLALVAKGPVVALIMLGVVVVVQQVEAHLLQPLLLGRAVRVHPLAVILGIAAGVVVGGIFGALVAVPLIAVLNAVGHHLLDPEPPGVDEPEDLLTPAEQAEVEQDVDDSEEMARIEPGERGPYDT